MSVSLPPFYGTLNENPLLRAQQNQEGNIDIYRLLSRYTYFWQNMISIQTCQTKVYRGLFRPEWHFFCTLLGPMYMRDSTIQVRETAAASRGAAAADEVTRTRGRILGVRCATCRYLAYSIGILIIYSICILIIVEVY